MQPAREGSGSINSNYNNMAKTARAKELRRVKPFILFYVIFTAIYICLAFFTGPFLMTWGQKRTAFEKAYSVFLSYPFNVGDSLWWILANAFAWAVVIYIIGICVVHLLRSRKSSA